MIKMKGRRNSKNNALKDPNEPQKPPKAYIRYARTVWEKVQNENPDMNIGSIGKYIGQMWRSLPDNQKEQFILEAQQDQIRYEEEVRLYQKSQLFQDFQKKKEMIKATTKVIPVNKVETNNVVNQPEKPIPTKKESWPDYSFLQVELESDEEDDFNEWKLDAFERFNRNHILMQEVFSDSRVEMEESETDKESVGINFHNIDYISSQLTQTDTEMNGMNQHHSTRIQTLTERNQQFQRLLLQQDSQLVNCLKQFKFQNSNCEQNSINDSS